MRIFAALLTLCVFTTAQAISPAFWEERTQEHFVDGDAQSVSISSQGELTLAPQMKKIYDGGESIIWKIVSDSKKNIYAATGNEGKLVKIDAAGKSNVVFDSEELEIQAIALDEDDHVFAATSPDGKIYRIDSSGKSSVFFDPDDKYIWSLVFDDSGNLYAGTGDQGKIYVIDKSGKGKVLIDTAEANITALAWDSEKQLLAGSDKNAILYSIDSTGKAFVLFDSDLQQVTAIYSDPGSAIYFAAIAGGPVAVETKVQPATPPPAQPPQTTAPPSEDLEGDEDAGVEVSTSVEMSPITPYPQPAPQVTGASQLYRISPDGLTEIFYTLPEDQILDISRLKKDSLLLSTGKKAKLISLDANRQSTILVKAPEEQITSLLIRDGSIWAATANPGTLYHLIENHSSKGSYYSNVKDTQTVSTWGRMTWKSSTPQGTSLQIFTRSGNTRTPDETWSDWAASGSGDASQIGSPKARFIQWRADFATTDTQKSPVLRNVSLAYLQQNIRPEVVSINVHGAGTVFRKAQLYAQESFAGFPEDFQEQKNQPDPAMQQYQQQYEIPPIGKQEYRRGMQTITWNATDQNRDELRYNLSYRREGEKQWKPLAVNLREKVFAWDTHTMPDGNYLVQVTVTDAGSNPKELVLSNNKESDPFKIDNSAPSLQVLKNDSRGEKVVLEVRAEDQFSPIKELEYSMKPGEWNILFPVDSINDSPVEMYKIDVPRGQAEFIIFKVTDQVNNVTTIRHQID